MGGRFGCWFQHRDFDRIKYGEASLRRYLELANRLDLIAKQLDADRTFPVGSKDIENSAAA